ncbi:hypothetical protein [Nitrosomonas sp. Nm132]|uniref:hypothetical protein n=1 Tax=Nitrosomonas sp. Nm132 TaxID=1881053 RepID=UPI00115FB401|nr:hypothetical protein [Nitrosomonas sp. Nm132]
MQAKTAMFPFSTDLIAGCKRFALLAQSAKEPGDMRCWNSACVMFAASAIESRVNEWIALAREIEGGPQPSEFWEEMTVLQKTLSLERKWNLIASVHGGEIWNGGMEPFQSYETIVALRNELVHFKGQFLEKNNAPNNRIRGLMSQLKIVSNSTFVEGDVSSWVSDLLEQRSLGVWVESKVRHFYEALLGLLLGDPNKATTINRY